MDRQHIIDNYGFDPGHYSLWFSFHFFTCHPGVFTCYHVDDNMYGSMTAYSCASDHFHGGRFFNHQKSDLDYLEDGKGTSQQKIRMLKDTKRRTIQAHIKNAIDIEHTAKLLHHQETGRFIVVDYWRYKDYFKGKMLSEVGVKGYPTSWEN